MKNVKAVGIVLTVLLSLASVRGAEFKCEFSKGWDRPANENAIKLAKALKVKTCNSEKFINYVKENKHTMNELKRTKGLSVKDLKFN